MTDRVLVLGASGVFGSRVVTLLERDGFTVLQAGRRGPVVLDRDGAELEARLAALAPAVVIDAAGPFQTYGDDPYRVARAALSAGAHYLDLCDDAAFTAGISVLDDAARSKGLVCLSGVSSVPALSSAAADALAEGMAVDLISTAILLGNRAPRGLSVVRAGLAQVGQSLRLWRGGAWTQAHGWGESRRFRLTANGRTIHRRASLIGAPDLTLFPARYGARTVEFRAGLELGLMQRGLAVLALPVRLGLVRSLAPLAPLLRRVSSWIRGVGSDRGGMIVTLRGQVGPDLIERNWTLIAEGGTGPMIPSVPALIVTRALLQNRLPPGSRPALGVFTLAEAEQELTNLNISSSRTETRFLPVFAVGLGAAFAGVPAPIADLHSVASCRVWQGRAEVLRGSGWLSRIIATLMRFPPAHGDVAVRVTMERRGDTEVWTRDFDGRRFRSHLSARPGQGLRERFGPLSFDIALRLESGALHYPVARGRFLGLPLPRFLLPVSGAREFVDDQGRACFDVALSHRLTGLIVRYRGWLAAEG